jgi:D-alanyl-D-alanine carboxypeptidase
MRDADSRLASAGTRPAFHGRRLAMLVAALTLVSCSSDGGIDREVAADLDAVVERWAGEAAAGGLVVRVDSPDGQRAVAAGPADTDGNALQGDEAFRIASITKTITAALALQLAEDGIVDLDAPLADVVPGRVERLDHGEELTLRQLLANTSGLPDELDLTDPADPWATYVQVGDGAAAAACGDVAGYLARHDPVAPVRLRPGTAYQYSNVGFRLAGEVIEAATGQPLADVYRERIFEPLGMDATWMDCVEEPRAELARGLHPAGIDDTSALSFELPDGDGQPLDVTDLGRHGGASGGLVSTSEDVAAFARALFEGDLFEDEATLAAMLEPGPAPLYGLGVELGDELGGDLIGHGGIMAGYNARLLYDPAHDLVIVALSNETANPHRTPVSVLAARAVHKVLTAPLLDGEPAAVS